MAYTNAVFYVDFENGNDATRATKSLVTALNPSGTITRLNAPAHGLVTGAVITASSFTSWLNGAWKITVVDADNFDLDNAVWQTTTDTSGSYVPYGGASKADAWKTCSSTGASSGRIAAGDEIRIMASSSPQLVGNATWTQGSKDIILPSAVTALISDCETAWTASADITTTTSTAVFKEGTRAVAITPLSAFTTGKIAYIATGVLDLSAFQQVSFWIRSGTGTANVYELRLCSDTVGDVPVHSFTIPALPSGDYVPITFDTGAALGASIQSVALYALLDPGTGTVYLDNIIACKASSSPDALTLASMIGKACSALSWEAATTYTVGDERKPSQPKRNGFRYKVSAQTGATEGTEPVWPEVIGGTVVDGGVTWVCTGLEDTWFPIQSIMGTTVKIDNGANTIGTAGRGYAGASETVATYHQVPIQMASNTSPITVTRSGNAAAYVKYTGGWDRTSMQSQNWETWVSVRGSASTINTSSNTYISISNVSSVRANAGVGFSTAGAVAELTNVHFSACTNYGISPGANYYSRITVVGMHVSQNATYGIYVHGPSLKLSRISVNSCMSAGLYAQSDSGTLVGSQLDSIDACNNDTYGVFMDSASEIAISNLTTRGNIQGGINNVDGIVKLRGASVSDTTEIVAGSAYSNGYVFSNQHDRIPDNHLIVTDGGTITSATDQRHTASGISWKFRPTATTRVSNYPLRLSIAKIACAANVAVAIGIWAYRDSTDIVGTLKVAKGQIAGIGADATVTCTPAIGTWEFSELTVTPTESGVIEVFFEVYDGVGTTNSFWIDDLTVS